MEDDEGSSSVTSFKEECDGFESLLELLQAQPQRRFPLHGLFQRRHQNIDILSSMGRRREVLQQVLDYIPASQNPDEVPEIDWFDCSKPLLKLCLSSVEFLRSLNGAVENMVSLRDQAFTVIEQDPTTGHFSVVSGLLVLIIELLAQIPWSNFSKKIEKRVKEDIDVVLTSFKKLMTRMERIEDTCRDLVNKCQQVFYKGPAYVPELPSRDSGFAELDHAEDSEVTIGLNVNREFQICGADIQFSSLEPPIQLGLLYMFMQHVQKHLETACLFSKEALKTLTTKPLMKKWSSDGITLSVFEYGLLVKSKMMVLNRMEEILKFAIFLNLQSKYVYSLRDALKCAKYNLENGPYPDIPPNFTSFQVSVGSDQRFREYIESGEWEDEAAAEILAQNYLKQYKE